MLELARPAPRHRDALVEKKANPMALLLQPKRVRRAEWPVGGQPKAAKWQPF